MDMVMQIAFAPSHFSVASSNDCDDSNPDTYPSAPELCDFEDNDCDGTLQLDEIDDDGDGYTECEGDCNPDPNNGGANQFPENIEICEDGIDQDCDGSDALCAQPSCLDWYNSGVTTSGTYQIITPSGAIYDIYCDMDVDEGGWTLVGTSLNTTLNDVASAYYEDLAIETPSYGNMGVWDGLRGLTNGDIRFTCRSGVNIVDISFMIRPGMMSLPPDPIVIRVSITQMASDKSIFLRVRIILMEIRLAGDQWNAGYLEGEDSCNSTDDFTIDFDDRGMDNQNLMVQTGVKTIIK